MRRSVIFSFIIIFLLTSGLGCKGLSKTQQDAIKPVELTYWRVFDDSDSMTEIINAYHQLHPQVTITYRKLLPDEFEKELINALAEDRGPDMFSIQNTWVGKYQSKIAPLPASVKSTFQSIEGTVSKQLVVTTKNIPSLTIKQIKDNFVGVVAGDVARRDATTSEEKIWGVPFAVDTLALFYNKDMLDKAGIGTPPKTWDEFLNDVIAMTKISADNKIIQAGAGIGGSTNVSRAFDILSVLMMQGGTTMALDDGTPEFHAIPQNYNQEIGPGEQALRFYTDFANTTKKGYTWNKTMPNSLDAFTRGLAGFFFGYSYNIPLVEARAPKLNYSVVPIPQLNPDAPINLANYWVETVSKKSAHQDESWDFIQFAASAKQIQSYLNKTKKPAALRELIAGQKDDPVIGPFAQSALTAKSWYKGRDANAAETSFLQMIDGVTNETALNDTEAYKKALQQASTRVGQTVIGP
ncbi:MAG: hypothetical protein UX10_C0007G0020 [Candidatus Magasanikbacteria bacterium GW2011_GWA2_45_39]|uniref:Extracellular solute-binding protein family 1 n=2 Tax=Candidatus Magasanikiibacteriota TaxID=1752731 RepID=A0A0G1MZ87_9BACT|nr:MAG: hypothetical protein UX10_C0007G0020 [Candidatus Magasanikbacteria bacterium GW2011_GWA2_45_39]KKU13676.1 MAG: hypothetical protein UX20_C0016G0024 [Candidatus Magasanikbacteria bacterium GW2011_GWC2_45_8]